MKVRTFKQFLAALRRVRKTYPFEVNPLTGMIRTRAKHFDRCMCPIEAVALAHGEGADDQALNLSDRTRERIMASSDDNAVVGYNRRVRSQILRALNLRELGA